MLLRERNGRFLTLERGWVEGSRNNREIVFFSSLAQDLASTLPAPLDKLLHSSEAEGHRVSSNCLKSKSPIDANVAANVTDRSKERKGRIWSYNRKKGSDR